MELWFGGIQMKKYEQFLSTCFIDCRKLNWPVASVSFFRLVIGPLLRPDILLDVCSKCCSVILWCIFHTMFSSLQFATILKYSVYHIQIFRWLLLSSFPPLLLTRMVLLYPNGTKLILTLRPINTSTERQKKSTLGYALISTLVKL